MQKKILSVLVALTLLMCTQAFAQKTFLWEISGNGLKESSYLFGTYHLLNSEYLEMLPKVKKALDDAAGVMLEVDADSMAMMQAMMPAMMMKDTVLSDLLDSAEYSLLIASLSSAVPIPPQVIDRIKPAILYVMIGVQHAQEANPKLAEYKGSPMDFHFAKEARSNGKPVFGLETINEQVDLLLNQHSLQKQADVLMNYVKKDKEETLEESRKLTRIYLDNEFNEILPLMKRYAKEYGEDLAVMLDDRNKRWIPAIEETINKQSVFIAVGAAHLPGENGVIQLLRDKGYKIKPIKH